MKNSRPSSPSTTCAPLSISFADMASRCVGIMLFITTSPPVAAAAIMYVPASIWSGIMGYVQPCSLLPPVMRITSVPAPFTCAPIMLRKFAVSTTCGSFAAFEIMVLPSAQTAASIMFIVAPTDTTSKYISAPTSLSAFAVIMPRCMLTSAPSARKPFIC